MRIVVKRVKLTDRFAKSATTVGRKSPIFMDHEVVGFGVQVRETGHKSFRPNTHTHMIGKRSMFWISARTDRGLRGRDLHLA